MWPPARLDPRMFYSGFQRFLLFWFKIFLVLFRLCDVTSQLAPNFLPPFYANWFHNNLLASQSQDCNIHFPARGREPEECQQNGDFQLGEATSGEWSWLYTSQHTSSGGNVLHFTFYMRLEPHLCAGQGEPHLHKFQPLARLNKFSLGLCEVWYKGIFK